MDVLLLTRAIVFSSYFYFFLSGFVNGADMIQHKIDGQGEILVEG